MIWPDSGQEDTNIYKVGVNHDEQYSIWLELRENQRLWKDAEEFGPEVELLPIVKKVWADVKPFSLLTEKFISLKTKLSYILSLRQKPADNDDSVLSHVKSHL